MRPKLYHRALFPAAGVLVCAASLVLAGSSDAADGQAPVGLGTAASYVVLAGSTVTNTGPSVLNGDVGLSPGTATPGLNELPGPATISGAQHITDAVALKAQDDLTTGYNDAAGRTPATAIADELTSTTPMEPGVYAGDALHLSGNVILDGHNDPDAVFVFKAASSLITSPNSSVTLLGVNPCNVYWQVTSSATLDTNTHFVGTIMALTSITANTGATVQGRLLARNGEVSLDDNTITRPDCAIENASPTPPPASSPASSDSTTASPTISDSSSAGIPSTDAPSDVSTTAGPTAGAPTNSVSDTEATPQRINRSITSAAPAIRTSTSTNRTSTSTLTNRTTSSAGIPPNVTTSLSGPYQPPHLAKTGTDSESLLLGGLFALTLGGALTLLGRRVPTIRARHRF